MNHLFCTLRGIPASHNFSVYHYVTILTLIFTSACNSTPNLKQSLSDSAANINLPSPTPLTKAESERLRIACEAWYDSVLKSRGFNGGIVVAKKGTIVFEAYNSTIPGNETPISDSTPLHIASVSKTFTAMAVLKLWQDGKCNIDDEYSKYFPTFNYPGVTIRTLLNHRSGLPNYVHFMENMGWNKKVNITNQDVFNFLITRKAELQNIGKPNTRFTYCNTNFALLALLIETVCGKSYGNYLQETFFSPLNMKHTFVFNYADSARPILSYDWKGRKIPLNFLDVVYGDKNIYSTPRDLLTWDKALNSGILFTENTLKEAYTPYSNERPGIRNYGLGWRMNNYPNGKKMIYHNGWWHGNNAAYIRLLADSATIVVLGNKENHNIYHAKDLADLFGNYLGGGEDEEAIEKNAGNLAKKLPAPGIQPISSKEKERLKKTSSKKETARQYTTPQSKSSSSK